MVSGRRSWIQSAISDAFMFCFESMTWVLFTLHVPVFWSCLRPIIGLLPNVDTCSEFSPWFIWSIYILLFLCLLVKTHSVCVSEPKFPMFSISWFLVVLPDLRPYFGMYLLWISLGVCCWLHVLLFLLQILITGFALINNTLCLCTCVLHSLTAC